MKEQGPDPKDVRIEEAKALVGETVVIMNNNVKVLWERDMKLSEMKGRAQDLEQGSSQFQQRSATLKREYWYKNMKMVVIISALLFVILIIIIIIASSTNT